MLLSSHSYKCVGIYLFSFSCIRCWRTFKIRYGTCDIEVKDSFYCKDDGVNGEFTRANGWLVGRLMENKYKKSNSIWKKKNQYSFYVLDLFFVLLSNILSAHAQDYGAIAGCLLILHILEWSNKKKRISVGNLRQQFRRVFVYMFFSLSVFLSASFFFFFVMCKFRYFNFYYRQC